MEGDEKPQKDFWDDYSQSDQAGQSVGGDFVLPNKAPNPEQIKSKKEKIVSALILVACLTAIFLIYFQSSAALNGPLSAVFKISNQAVANLPADQSGVVKDKLASMVDLKKKDTDNDGLSDYDETYIYKTSPYLADSDGDGVLDKKEVDTGHDPNCPGSDNCCRGETGDTATVSGSNQQQLIAQQQALSNEILSGKASVATIRAALIQGGMTAENLSSVSDADLVAMYQETINSGVITQVGQVPAGSVATSTVAAGSAGQAGLQFQSIDELKKLSGAQIRALLLQEGAPADQLSQISDDDLKTVFLQKLEDQINSQSVNSNN